jgi:hypothetical protein
MFVFGNTIDGVLIMGYRLGAAWVNFCCGHDSLDRSTVMFYAGGGGNKARDLLWKNPFSILTLGGGSLYIDSVLRVAELGSVVL